MLTSTPAPFTPPWYSSETVGMRTARPSEALTTQLGAACQASAALGETQLLLRSGWATLAMAFAVRPPLARQCSSRSPSTAFQPEAKRQVSWPYTAWVRVRPPKAALRAAGAPSSQSGVACSLLASR